MTKGKLFKSKSFWYWQRANVSLPEFVEGQAKGEMKMFDGRVYKKAIYSRVWLRGDKLEIESV